MANRKAFRTGAFLAVLFFIFSFAFAQSTGQAQIVRKTVLDYKDELKLTDKQIEKIKICFAELENKNKELAVKISSIDQEVRMLLDKNSDINQISKKIKESFNFRAEAVVAEIEAGRKIDKVLTTEQLKVWKEIKLKEAQKIKGAAK